MSSCPFVSLMDIQSLFHERAITKKFCKKEKNHQEKERKKIKIDPRLLIEQWPTTWTEPTMRVMGSIQSARNLGNVHHSRSQWHKGKGKLLHFIHTHKNPPPHFRRFIYTDPCPKKKKVTTLSIFWVSRKRLKMTFLFCGGIIIIISVSGYVCVETLGCFTSSKRCIKT